MNRHFDFMSDRLGFVVHVYANVHNGKCLEYELTDDARKVLDCPVGPRDALRVEEMIEFWCNESLIAAYPQSD